MERGTQHDLKDGFIGAHQGPFARAFLALCFPDMGFAARTCQAETVACDQTTPYIPATFPIISA
jgi:hypothetical protein